MRIGLTGGIGSGKSTAAAMLQSLGWRWVDMDAIARQLTQPGGPAMASIASRFGQHLIAPDGGLDRVAMRKLVFEDPQAKAQLEGILHPLIVEVALRQAADVPAVVFDVPLLTESHHWRARVERVLVIDCAEEVQVSRVAQRPGWSAEQARSVIATQATRTRRRQVADAVIDNSQLTIAELNASLRGLSRHWRGPVEESSA